MNFDQEVDGEDPNVYILVLFYQDYLVECSLLESILRNLAPYYPYLKFMRARNKLFCVLEVKKKDIYIGDIKELLVRDRPFYTISPKNSA